MPRKMWTPLRVNPRTRPAVVSTTVSSVQTRMPSVRWSELADDDRSPLSVVQPGRATPRAAPPTTAPADLRSQSRRLKDEGAGICGRGCCLLIDKDLAGRTLPGRSVDRNQISVCSRWDAEDAEGRRGGCPMEGVPSGAPQTPDSMRAE